MTARCDVGLVDEPLHLARALEPVVQALLTPDVVVLEVDRPQLRVASIAVPLARGRPPGVGTSPPSRARDATRAARFPARSRRPPTVRGPRGSSGVSSSRSTYFFACSKYSHWSCTAIRRLPSASGTSTVQVRSREISCRARTGSLEREVREEPVLDHLQHDRGRPDLQELRDLAHVRVADDHVQAPVLLRVGVGLVARVDDRPLQRGLEPHLGLEEVGALRELVDRPAALVPRGLGARASLHRRRPAGRRRTASGHGRCRRRASAGPRGSSRGCRRSCPCRPSCSCRSRAAASPAAGWRPPAASVRGSAPPPCRGSRGRAP